MNNEEMTICQVCEYLATMIDDKEQLEAIDYIETKAKHLCEALKNRNDEFNKLKKEFDEYKCKMERMLKTFK